MSKIVGIVVAKHESKRFPGKNFHNIDGKPMFWYNVECLLESKLVDDVVVATDDEENIKSYCEERGVKVIWRSKNASNSEEPLFDVIKYTYKSLDYPYQTIVNIMANSIGNKVSDVDKCINLLKNNNLKEVRSYSQDGVENGILVLDGDSIYKHEISSYTGMVVNGAKEIHYKEELK